MLSEITVHGARVVHAKATDLRDARFIAERVVSAGVSDFSDLLVYVRLDGPPSPITRRVQWRRGHGFDTLEFATAGTP